MFEKIKENFSRSIKKLEKVLEKEKTEENRDSAIKKFEICFDLAWKSIKIYAKKQGIECYSPNHCFHEGYNMGLISYSEKWIKLIEDRNMAVHFYSEGWADGLYKRLPEYLDIFRELEGNL